MIKRIWLCVFLLSRVPIAHRHHQIGYQSKALLIHALKGGAKLSPCRLDAVLNVKREHHIFLWRWFVVAIFENLKGGGCENCKVHFLVLRFFASLICFSKERIFAFRFS